MLCHREIQRGPPRLDVAIPLTDMTPLVSSTTAENTPIRRTTQAETRDGTAPGTPIAANEDSEGSTAVAVAGSRGPTSEDKRMSSISVTGDGRRTRSPSLRAPSVSTIDQVLDSPLAMPTLTVDARMSPTPSQDAASVKDKDSVRSLAVPSVPAAAEDPPSRPPSRPPSVAEKALEPEAKRLDASEAVPELTHSSIDMAPSISDETKSGWAAISKSIRDVDEQKIQDYKEDIDNILVFVSTLRAWNT